MRVSDKNGKGLKSSGGFSDSGEVNSIQAAAKEVKKSRLYLVLLGGIGGGAALVYLKPKVKERREMCVILMYVVGNIHVALLAFIRVERLKRENDKVLRFLVSFFFWKENRAACFINAVGSSY